jgi:hypothetical protein
VLNAFASRRSVSADRIREVAARTLGLSLCAERQLSLHGNGTRYSCYAYMNNSTGPAMLGDCGPMAKHSVVGELD